MNNGQCSTAIGDAFLCIAGQCQEAECNDGRPCSLGRVCDDDLHICRDCEAHSECEDDSVCDLSSFGGTGRCREGECTLKTQDTTCETGLCESGMCASCDETNQCGRSWQGDRRVCDAGYCVLGECTEAQETAHCTTNLCVDHECVSCNSDGDCGDGRVCDQTSGTCIPGECVVDTDCGAASTQCYEQVCVSTPDGKRCQNEPLSEGSCSDGKYCTVNDHCLDGQCVSGGARDCSSENTECRISGCNENQNKCEVGAIKPGACNDNNRCTEDICSAAGTCSNSSFCWYDSAKSIMWTRDRELVFDQNSGESHCDNLAIGGYSDWSLPNDHLAPLVDPRMPGDHGGRRLPCRRSLRMELLHGRRLRWLLE